MCIHLIVFICFHVICIHLVVILFICYSLDVAKMMIAAKQLGMQNGEYMFVAIDLEFSSKWDLYSWGKQHAPVTNFLNGIVSVRVSKVSMRDSRFKSFNDDVFARCCSYCAKCPAHTNE